MTSLRASRRREAGRVSTYFLDESGNTGDVSKTGPSFEFDRQPLFVLACFGIEDVADMGREMERIRAAHRIKASEVKATSLAAKPQFVTDLLAYGVHTIATMTMTRPAVAAFQLKVRSHGTPAA